MAEYISRDDVLRKFIEGDGHDDDRFTEGYNFAVQEYREKVKKIPAADVQSVKHGAWVSYNWHEGIFDGWGIQCDKCLERYKYGLRKKNFCPNCGARMDGDTD